MLWTVSGNAHDSWIGHLWCIHPNSRTYAQLPRDTKRGRSIDWLSTRCLRCPQILAPWLARYRGYMRGSSAYASYRVGRSNTGQLLPGFIQLSTNVLANSQAGAGLEIFVLNAVIVCQRGRSSGWMGLLEVEEDCSECVLDQP